MKQNTLNDSLEIYHLCYSQILFKNGVLHIMLKYQEVGQCWQSTHIRSKQLLETITTKIGHYISQNSISIFMAQFVSNFHIKWNI